MASWGLIGSDGVALIADNVIRDNDPGLSLLGAEAMPALTGDVICDNTVNVKTTETVPPLELEADNAVGPVSRSPGRDSAGSGP